MFTALSEMGIKVNREKLIAAARKYKKEMKKQNLERILSCIK